MGQVAHTHDQHGDIQWMMAAMARMFRPLIRFSVGRVSCSALVDMIKELYVAEAREHLQQQNPDRRVTYSSLALLCGIDGRAIQAIERNSGRTYTARMSAPRRPFWKCGAAIRHSPTRKREHPTSF